MAAGQVTSVVVAIDTTDYSGNFERKMCAFVTGVVGECEVGADLAEGTINDLEEGGCASFLEWIDEHIVHESDDNGCHRPCSIWPTPGRVNNGSGQHFNEADLPKDQSWQGVHWPAYESVAIFFDEVPPKEVVDIMIDRAKWFAMNRPDHCSYMGELKPLTITGFRVLMPTLTKPRQIDHVETARFKA